MLPGKRREPCYFEMGATPSTHVVAAVAVAGAGAALYLHIKSERRRRSAGERDDGPPQLKSGEWFAERMGESSIFLDESRLQVVREAALTLEQLVSGQLVGANGFCRLVLGGKGVKRKRMESVSLQISTWKFYGLYFPSFRTKS
jgi:hypothetical protein